MNTPIYDFCKKYSENKLSRFHMPGHKGQNILGFESLDITEIDGADSLFEADGIIRMSEENAGSLFGAESFYSTEGSSLCIRAMLYLTCIYAKEKNQKPRIAAGRNAHKAFLSAAAMLDFDIDWLYGDGDSYLSCPITPQAIDSFLQKEAKKITAVYLTSPDYLGNICDIEEISKVCKKHDVLLLVDNAHGAYLKFLESSAHPIDLGASMCCDSAHKTLPSLTGGAYLHISHSANKLFCEQAKNALSLFATTSPSYLILESLDLVNKYLAGDYKNELKKCIKKVDRIKEKLKFMGIDFFGDEPIKLTIAPKSYGYSGEDFANELLKHNIMCEFKDPDFTVLMFTPQIPEAAYLKLEKAIESIPKKTPIKENAPKISRPEIKMTVRDAVFSPKETLAIEKCKGRILSSVSVSCPPAVPIIVSGEVIDETAIDVFSYYGIKSCVVIK